VLVPQLLDPRNEDSSQNPNPYSPAQYYNINQSINQSINQIKSNQSIRKQSFLKNPNPYSPAQYYNNQSINPINILVRCTQKSEHQNQSIKGGNE